MEITNRVLSVFVILCFLLGAAAHLSFIFRQSEMLADRPFRDDGFYALTVSRNLAMGKGLSVSNGEIATNGIQPVFVFLCSLPYLITQNQFEAMRLVQGLNFAVHILSTIALFILVRQFAKRKTTPGVAAALWMASYSILKFSSNGLETGLYFLMIICTVYAYMKLINTAGSQLHPVYDLLFGILLGLTTLTRIDAGILALAIALHYLWLHRRKGFFRCLIHGPVIWLFGWLFITLPWWLYNVHLTGSPLPISGLVQTISHTTNSFFNINEFLINIWYALSVVLDNLLFVVFTPLRMIKQITAVSLLLMAVRIVVLAVFILLIHRKRKLISLRTLLPWKQLAFYPLFLSGLVVFYVFFFNVEWYMNRYLSPVAIASVLVLSMLLEKLKPFWTVAFLSAAILFTALISGYSYPRRFNTMYEYHWGWVRDNVSPDTWVAASQSGTLGYFHDRTINTDGKVNSELFFVPTGQVGTYLAERNAVFFIEWEESYVFADSSFLELYEHKCDYGLCRVWQLTEAK